MGSVYLRRQPDLRLSIIATLAFVFSILALFQIMRSTRDQEPELFPEGIIEPSSLSEAVSNNDRISEEVELYNVRVKRNIESELDRIQRSAGHPTQLRTFTNLKEVFHIAPSYDLSYCNIEKCLSSRMVGIFCYLLDTNGFKSDNRNIAEEHFAHDRCYGKNIIHSILSMGHHMDRSTTFYIIREPIGRFISAFVDKCIHERVERNMPNVCYGCKTNLTCVVDNLYHNLRKYSAEDINWEFKADKVVTYEAKHFCPLTWYCNLSAHYQKYTFLQYGHGYNFAEQFLTVLKRNNVEEWKLREIADSLDTKKRTHHGTFGSKEVQQTKELLYSNPDLMRKLMEIYDADYRIFEFARPAGY